MLTEQTEEHSYIYAGGKLLRETVFIVDEQGSEIERTLDFRYDNAGLPFALHYKDDFEGIEQTYYYITNLQGDVMYIVDEDGGEIASYEYDPYGKLLRTTGDFAETNPIRYRGYYYDTDTDFYYLQSRYYDPAICRFINMDSYISTGQGILGYNAFAYCGNNPIIRKDPTGTDALILCNEGGFLNPGHVGALVQDENGTWWHFYWGTANPYENFGSKNGLVTSSACLVGAQTPSYTWCVEYTGDDISLNAINATKQYAGTYNAVYRLQGDFSMCIEPMKNADGKYNLYNNNCFQVTFKFLSLADTHYNDILNAAAQKTLPVWVSQCLKNYLPHAKSMGGGGCRKVMCLY